MLAAGGDGVGGPAVGRDPHPEDRAGGDRRVRRGEPGRADHRRERLQRGHDAAVQASGAQDTERNHVAVVAGRRSDELQRDPVRGQEGKEQLYIHAEKNQDIEVENDETHTVGVDRSKTIGRSETTAVGKDRTETVGSDESISIGANRTEAVGSNESVSIGANRSVDVGANDGLTVGANLSITVGSALSTEVSRDASERVGGNQQIQVGKKFALVAADQIQLQTGSASLTLKKDGTILLKGKDITIQGSGKISMKASSKVTIKGELDPRELKHHAPAEERHPVRRDALRRPTPTASTRSSPS